jgi:hypothetical protein
MHRSPSTQLRTPEFPRYAVASCLCCLALSFTFWSNSAENEHLLLGKELARRWGRRCPTSFKGLWMCCVGRSSPGGKNVLSSPWPTTRANR